MSTPVTPPPSGSTYKPGEFLAASTFAAQCKMPRTGTDPTTGKAYVDKAGSTTTENYWLRSWTNDLYLWYSEVPDSNPALTNDTLAYFDLLKTSATTPSGAAKDKFHFTYNTADWIALSGSGDALGYGIDWEVDSPTPPRAVYVRYVEPGSAAATAGITRGLKILLTDNVDVVSENTSAGVDKILEALYPTVSGGAHQMRFTNPATSATLDVTLTSSVVTSNPVPLVSAINTSSGSKVGYLLFNSHNAPAEAKLVAAVNTLKAAGIQDLVLDLRYNGGGYLDIANELAYMIAGPAQAAGKTFESIQFNDKHKVTDPVTGATLVPDKFITTTQGFSLAAGSALPTLGLTRVYVLTTADTCSASESIINGLKGAGVIVNQIGVTTCGKPYGFYPEDNCGTTYFSIQFRGINQLGFGDYPDGFSATRSAATGAAQANLPGCGAKDDLTHQLGDPTEEQLRVALSYRETGQCTAILPFAAENGSLKQAAATVSGEGGAALLRPSDPWHHNRILGH
ncbi:MAG: S41 family peptidase [Pseudomonadota bacterium]